MTFDELQKMVDSFHALFLREISEPAPNRLRLILEEATAGEETISMKVGGTVIEDLHPVRRTGRFFVLEWSNYVAYSVRNESFASPDSAREVRESGSFLRIYGKSTFLEFVSEATIASAEYPGPLIHVCVVAEMHVIDVVSVQLPETRILPTRS